MTDDATYAIFLGADMDPERIQARADMDGGRFAGIGAVPIRDLAGLELPLPDAEELWGVVMRLPGRCSTARRCRWRCGRARRWSRRC